MGENDDTKWVFSGKTDFEVNVYAEKKYEQENGRSAAGSPKPPLSHVRLGEHQALRRPRSGGDGGKSSG